MLTRLALCLASLLLPSVAISHAKAERPAQEIACQFETVFESKAGGTPSFKSAWRLLRRDGVVESWQLGGTEGEVFELDGAGGVQVRRFFLAERVEVFYSAMELKVLGRPQDWNQCYSVVAPAFLKEKLAHTGTEVLLGVTVEKYEGEVEGRRWRVLWSEPEQLAYQVRVESERGVSTSTLTERHPLRSAPWETPRKPGYHLIDFADLGDSESNPRFRRVMSRLGISCSHKSCAGICLPQR